MELALDAAEDRSQAASQDHASIPQHKVHQRRSRQCSSLLIPARPTDDRASSGRPGAILQEHASVTCPCHFTWSCCTEGMGPVSYPCRLSQSSQDGSCTYPGHGAAIVFRKKYRADTETAICLGSDCLSAADYLYLAGWPRSSSLNASSAGPASLTTSNRALLGVPG